MVPFYTLIVDDTKFFLSRKTIEKSDILLNIIDGISTNDHFYINENNIYIDRDSKSFSYIIDLLRGYDVNVNYIVDFNLRKRVEDDAKYFGLHQHLKKNFDVPNINMECEDDMEDNTGDNIKNIESKPDYNQEFNKMYESLKEARPFFQDFIHKVSTDNNMNQFIKNMNGIKKDESDVGSSDLETESLSE